MNGNIKQAILDKISAYSRIILFRHIRMDGDCVGATKGLKALLQASFPEKEVWLPDSQHSEYLAFLGPDDGELPEETYRDALGIVLDCGDRKRISNQRYALCRELIKIDHHIEVDAYGDLRWVEPDRSSACEMVADLARSFPDTLILTREAAAFLMTGMVTDSDRFRFSGVTGDTLRLAGMLLDRGVDMDTLYAHLYLQDFESLRLKSHVYGHMRVTPNGVAVIEVPLSLQREFSLDSEAAGNVISYLENIRGCLCWLAFIENGDSEGGIRVRLRSRFMTVNALANLHHGGGHANASGATVYSREEMEQLIREADAAAGEYKRTHEGWM